MKKKLKTMAMALMAVAAVAGFAACSSSDDDNTTSGTYGKITFDYTFSDDFRNVVDVKLSYLDSDGKTRKTETITSSPFHREVIYKSLPITAKDTLTLTLKANYPEKDKYNLKFTSKVIAYKMKNNEAVDSTKREKNNEQEYTKADMLKQFPSSFYHTLTILGD